MSRVVFAGNVLVDALKTLESWPERGCIAQVLGMSRSVGGCVCNTGIDLKRLDPAVDVVAHAVVGKDDNGDFAVGVLAENGLDVSHVSRIDAPTTSTDVMALQSTGERTFFCMRGAGALYAPSADEIPAGSGDLLHLGYLLLLDALDSPDPEYGTRAARLLADVRSRGIRTSIDLVSEQSPRVPSVLKPALPHCDYVVMNEVEAAAITGIPARDADGRIDGRRLEELARAVAGYGVRDKTVIHCPEGSGAVDAAGRFEYLPSLVLPAGWIKGAVGAGDAFCSGMLYSFIQGWDVVRGMHLARAAAAANLASSSGTGGALGLDETLELDRRFDPSRGS